MSQPAMKFRYVLVFLALAAPQPDRHAPNKSALAYVGVASKVGGPAPSHSDKAPVRLVAVAIQPHATGAVRFTPDEPTLGNPPQSAPAGIPQDWATSVMRGIAASEYHIRWQERAGAFQSPNREHDMRITYHADGFDLRPRVTDSAWAISFRLDRIGRENAWQHPCEDAAVSVEGSRLLADHGSFAIDYHNSEYGMRQNFTVREKPLGNGPLEVRLKYTSQLRASDKGGNTIAFCEPVAGTGSYVPRVWYKDLHVWDANGDTLEATANLKEDDIVLTVNDDAAEYPITVDPLSTTADWIAESGQVGASFGNSVASAGDVNGDGYSDVIVGAWSYDGGQADEGRAFVFHGSATGLHLTADWSAGSGQLASLFGNSVASAGDVNGDGYSDVIIGAFLFDVDQTEEGRVFVYHGGASGLSTTANWTAESDQVSATLGNSVACAGDVNGDGYSDVIVGAEAFDNGQDAEGRAFVYHGGPTGLNTTPNWTAESNQTNALFGGSVASAGDVNGDGFSDVIVGARWYDGVQSDEGRAYVYHGSATGLSTTANWTAESDQNNASFSTSVACAGDVNGDGYSDVIVGAPGFDNGQTDEGRAFVFHGSVTGLSTTANWIKESDQANALFGRNVSCAGDVNGDGYSDVIAGADGFDNGQTDEGRAFVFHGSATGLPANSNWSADSDQANASFGWSLAAAGDVNGDGYSDVVIGAPNFDNGQAYEGRAFVFHGAAQGLSTSSNWTLEGNQASAQFGLSVASAGDVNGDGLGDVIIGAPYYDNGQTDEGRAFVCHGKTTGLYLTDWSVESNQAGARFGNSVASAGDVNGDGYGDVIVGAPGYANGQSQEGRAYVFHGSATGLNATPAWTAESDQVGAQYGVEVASAGDVNGDGYGDVIVGAWTYSNGQTQEGRSYAYHGSASGLNSTAQWTVESDQANADFGISVSSAGDVNGDGFSDVIVGAWRGGNQSQEGRIYVYHGSATGLSAMADWTAESDQVNARLGISVATAGDVNGDGYSDVIAAALYYSNGQLDEGRAFVYHGSPAGLSATADWTAESDQTGAHCGYVASAGDVNGDGYSDVIICSNSYTNGQSQEGRAFLYYGSTTGLSSAPNWTAESDQVLASFGSSASSAGDVNGDGYSDVVVGTHSFDNGETNEGRVFWYHGNGAIGRRSNERLYDTNVTSPLSAGNKSSTLVGAGLYARPFLGRQRMRAVWETCIQGSPFSSAGGKLANSAGYSGQQLSATLTATGGTELKSVVTKPVSAYPLTVTNVRTRLRYNPATAITGQVFGPWRYSPEHLAGRSPRVLSAPTACETVLPSRVAAKLFLDGPFQGGSPALMSDLLRTQALLPLTEPYSALGLPITAGPNTIAPSILATTGNNAIVDWVLVELRNLSGTTLAERRVALVQRDGDVVALDGTSSLGFCSSAGAYRVAVRHRNHLGCMTSQDIALSSTPTVLDLTTATLSTYGTDARKTSGSVRLLWAGNTNGNTGLKYTGSGNDRDPVLLSVGSTTPNNTVSGTYSMRDVNMDGQVKYTGSANDRDPILQNVGSTTPNNVRLEQLP
ncbi:MAG: FG-GAP repeat protein [Flavobacteriales bacterium]|nr:FG-GAP repeat protein [Flavobacteriales bacterium]